MREQYPPRSIFEQSADVKLLITHLHKKKEGEFASYKELSDVVGRPITGGDGYLQSAKNCLERDYGVYFKNVRGEGYVRLDSAGMVNDTDRDKKTILRKADRALQKLGDADFSELTEDEIKKANHNRTALGIVTFTTNPRNRRRLDYNFQQKMNPMDVLDSMFGRQGPKPKEGQDRLSNKDTK